MKSALAIILMASGAPAEMNPQTIAWYQNFEKGMGWKSYGMALNDAEAAKETGASIK